MIKISKETRGCPYCKEEIKTTAIKCKHCQTLLCPIYQVLPTPFYQWDYPNIYRLRPLKQKNMWKCHGNELYHCAEYRKAKEVHPEGITSCKNDCYRYFAGDPENLKKCLRDCEEMGDQEICVYYDFVIILPENLVPPDIP